MLEKNNLETALLYASWGWHVLPVVPNGKNPASRHGVNDATTVFETITRWWTQNPEYNIGIAAGAKSGIIVFDIDPRNGGDVSFNDWLKQHGGEMPDTQHQLTAGGGSHFVFEYDERLKSCKVAEGIDLLSDGRYFLVAPSKIGPAQYHWELSSDPGEGAILLKMPESWIDTILNSTKTRVKVAGGEIIQGNRNSGLASLGGYLRNAGMTVSEILAALIVTNENRCDPPLPSSEVRQIAHSVGSYDAETDIAANAAIGSEAAEALLGADIEKSKAGFFLIPGKQLLSQPSPLQWIVKGWIPENSLSMVYGASEAGKSFITIDLALHVACGIDWFGHRVKRGRVVYLAGEGNFGIRQRVAAWCQHFGTSDLEDFFLSSRAIDLDNIGGVIAVTEAVRDLTTEKVDLIFIDTLNNHMGGDENTAKDTRKMISHCGLISEQVGGTVVLNHHVGNSQEAKARARGSSAWKASLDSAIQVVRVSEDTIEISCAKMKDAKRSQTFYVDLQEVPIEGWIDDDSEQVTSCVIVESTKPATEKRPPKIQEFIKILQNCWNDSGGELDENENPYVSRSAVKRYLSDTLMKKEKDIKNNLCPGEQGKLIGALTSAGIVSPSRDGWVICCGTVATQFKFQKD